ncbi:MAG: extracellular solute-binding protein [Oscillospiraceae bacterium]|nr:extracellular solute-binding protein [Oscillospiraceae bacterium]
MKKLIALLLAAVFALTLLSGCKSGADKPAAESGGIATELTEPVELVIWNTYTEHHAAAFQEILDDFNASQDMITVTVQTQPYQDFDSKLMQAVRNGTGPDIVTAFPTAVANYIQDDLIVDFAPYIADEKIGIANFKDDMVGDLYSEITQWDASKIYMIPTIVTSEVLFYNKTMYDELGLKVPTTWAELESNSRAIYEAKGIPGFGSDSATDTWQGLIVQAGSGYIDADTKTVAFDNDIALEKLTWYSDLVKEGVFRLVGEDFYFSNPFGSQAVGSYIGSSAGVDYAVGAANGAFEVGCAPIPQDGKVPYISSWGGGYIAFKTTDEKALAAYEFLKYFAQPEVCAKWAIAFGAVPAYNAAVATDAFKQYAETNIAAKALSEEINNVGYLSSIAGSAGVRTAIDKMIQESAMGVTDPKDALANCVAESNAELAQ